MTGTDSSRARALRPREISETSWTRLASLLVVVACIELQVVDDHEIETGLGLQPAGLGAQLHGADVRRVVDVHRRLGQRVHRRRDAGEVELVQETGAELLRVDVGDAREQAQDQLLLAHLQAEDTDALALAHGGVLGDVEGERRLADRGTRCDHDQVARLESRRERIEVGEAAPDARDLTAVGVQVVETVVRIVEQRLERAEAGVDALLADGEQLRLGPVDRLLDLGRILVADAGDAAGGTDEVPQHGLAFDDPGVLRCVDGGRRLVAQARQVGPAAHGFEVLAALERLRHGDDVDRLAALEQVEDRGIDAAVGLTVEILGPQELGDLDDGIAVDEDGAENGLLGFETLWRKAVDHVSPR